MFGLTRREQRWKAEQQAAELVVGLVGLVAVSAAKVREAEALAEAKAKDVELERLRLRVAELEATKPTTDTQKGQQ